MLNKVPEITVYFWVIKVLCTTVGETASDYLAGNLNLGLTKTTYITGSVLLITLFFQFRATRYVPVDLLALGCPHQRGRHADHGQPDRQPRNQPRDDDDRLQHRTRRHVRRLVRERGDALHSHDLYDQARGVLLARDPVHVRARHCGRRPCRRAAECGLLDLGPHLRRNHRGHRGGALPLPAQCAFSRSGSPTSSRDRWGRRSATISRSPGPTAALVSAQRRQA